MSKRPGDSPSHALGIRKRKGAVEGPKLARKYRARIAELEAELQAEKEKGGQGLGQEDLRRALQATRDDVALLNRVIGNPPRNAMAIIKGLTLKLEYAYSKPKQEVEHSGKIGLETLIAKTYRGEPVDE